jgi:uncharacterized membrane protein
MNAQQLRQPAMALRRSLAPVIGLGLAAAALATALVVRPAVPAQPAAPVVHVVESWSPGGHLTGSVYDGGAYGTLKAESWSPGGHLTGSVYDGGDYGVRRFATGAPMTHLTGSVYEPR